MFVTMPIPRACAGNISIVLVFCLALVIFDLHKLNFTEILHHESLKTVYNNQILIAINPRGGLCGILVGCHGN